MDWQDVIALVIVGVTAGVFVWNRFRHGKLRRGCGSHCGCGSEAGRPGGERIIFRARKGERPEILVKPKQL